MKTAVWAYTAAMGLTSLGTALTGGCFGNIYYHWFDPAFFHGKPLPLITAFLVAHYLWALALPFLWFPVAVWLSRKGVATPERILGFAGLSTLAICFLITFTAISLLSPFVSITQ